MLTQAARRHPFTAWACGILGLGTAWAALASETVGLIGVGFGSGCLYEAPALISVVPPTGQITLTADDSCLDHGWVAADGLDEPFLQACDGSPCQEWTIEANHEVQDSSGQCLTWWQPSDPRSTTSSSSSLALAMTSLMISCST
jgi:hypothetical protein